LTQNQHFLITEDEAISAMFLEMVLKDLGYKVSIVASGEAAVNFCQINCVDFIIMDIHLAGSINGIEASKKIREFCNMPIIFITGYQPENFIAAIEDYKNCIIIAKPINANNIKQAIMTINSL